ncbi:hypothetical protein [Anaerosacchariphilus polymeriproducens]|uniref:Uncharacterized protein n=1 Tax=Anaerosacchariphilus polymeriproducens TaxID=1812858 RepID=A0A371AST4_9FIRM|nr:hypothetical protein [Anaerosacchariphilus polymeriproducens]RDU22609.1 hypothetical protein DWV06_15150 [Anaerosacchariphilus polymeriproducens]
MFGSNKKQIERIFQSNVRLEQLGFMEQLDREVAVIMDNDTISIDKVVYMCITPDSLNQTVKELMEKNKKQYTYAQTVLGIVVDNVIQQESNQVLIISGLLPRALIITKEDLLLLKDVIDSFCIMYAAARNNMNNDKAYDLLKEKTVYIIGTLLLPNMNKGDTFGIEIMRREVENGQEYEAVKCFLTKENAEKYNPSKREISPVTVAQIKEFYGNVIIEPHRNYWIEF